MKQTALVVVLLMAVSAPLWAGPKFWNSNVTETPTPPAPPDVQEAEPGAQETPKPTATPALAPLVTIPTPTPTPQPGLSPLNPTQAALFSVVVPGSGQVYAGDPLKGLVFATLFGVGLWQTIDNLSLVPSSPGSTDLIAKNETAGNLFGLATLAAYGFGIQDAYSTAANYNKTNHLTLQFGITPRPNASLAFTF